MNRIAMILASIGCFSASVFAQPPGTERMVVGVETETIDWALQEDLLYGGKYYDPSKRIIDFEIVLWKPDEKKVFGYKLAVSLVRCENVGVLEANSGFMFAAPHAEMLALAKEQTRRATDLEVSIIKGDARYSVVTVMNEGAQASPWQWIPLVQVDSFFNLLSMSKILGWRPTDIEFLEHGGQTFATALLAPATPIDLDLPLTLETTHFGFGPDNDNLEFMLSDGWQPIDIEQTPFLNDQFQYYGVFVRPGGSLAPAIRHDAFVGYETPLEVIHAANTKASNYRLIDIEGIRRTITSKKGFVELAQPNTFTTIHLLDDLSN